MMIAGMNRVLARLIWVCVAVATSTVSLVAQSPSHPRAAKPSPSVNSILDRYVTALGGAQAWKKASTRVINGSVVLSPPLLQGTVELYQTAPDKMFFQIKVPRLGIAWVLVNGNQAWQKDFASDPRQLQGDELADARIDADFCKEVDLRKLYSRMEYGGSSEVNSQPVDIIRAYTASGRSHTLYFDRSTGLLVQEDFVSVGTHGPETVQTFFGDYRELSDAGIKYPFEVKQVTGRAVQEMHFEDVQHNVPVDKSLFAVPVLQQHW